MQLRSGIVYSRGTKYMASIMDAPFRFLDLPPEVRNMIYDFLFRTNDPNRQIAKIDCGYFRSMLTGTTSGLQIKMKDDSQLPPCTILRVCKQLNGEAMAFALLAWKKVDLDLTESKMTRNAAIDLLGRFNGLLRLMSDWTLIVDHEIITGLVDRLEEYEEELVEAREMKMLELMAAVNEEETSGSDGLEDEKEESSEEVDDEQGMEEDAVQPGLPGQDFQLPVDNQPNVDITNDLSTPVEDNEQAATEDEAMADIVNIPRRRPCQCRDPYHRFRHLYAPKMSLLYDSGPYRSSRDGPYLLDYEIAFVLEDWLVLSSFLNDIKVVSLKFRLPIDPATVDTWLDYAKDLESTLSGRRVDMVFPEVEETVEVEATGDGQEQGDGERLGRDRDDAEGLGNGMNTRNESASEMEGNDAAANERLNEGKMYPEFIVYH